MALLYHELTNLPFIDRTALISPRHNEMHLGNGLEVNSWDSCYYRLLEFYFLDMLTSLG